MSNEELDKLAQSIFEQMQVSILPEVDSFKWTYDTCSVRKLLRSIEIAALREAQELVEKHIEQCPDSSTDEEVCWISADALNALANKIRELELK